MKKILLLTLTFLMSTVFISAQNTNGKITGTVSAPDGAVPGATVVVTDNQTGSQRTITTSSDGTFNVPQLEFGTYTVKITAEGFKTFTANDVKIDAGREYSLNARLEVGQVSEQVTVTAGADQVNSSNAELSSTISQQQIRELPLNGRNPLTLLNLIAGANPTTNSINGQRSSSTDYRRDGLNVQDNFIRTGGFVSDQPTVDNTGEFTVVTQNAGVELGGGSSLIQLVTPRGGKDFHGAAYIFNRNSEFTANSFFNNADGTPKPFLNRNEFGGSFSGPLPVPNIGQGGPVFAKNKAYFFFNYEGFRLAQQVRSRDLTTLLPQARNGNFTFINAAGQQTTINVLTGTNFVSPLTTNQGGVLAVDPIIQRRILDRLPTSGTGNTSGINFTQTTNLLLSDPRERNAYTGRLDFDINDRNFLNFVYKRNNDQDARTDIASGFSTTPFVNQGGPSNFFVGAYRMIPTNNFTNEIRGGFQYSEPFFNEGNVPSDFLLALPLVTNPEGTFRSQGRNTDYRNIQDNAVYTLGNHSLRFGGQAEFYKLESLNFVGTTPTFSIANTGNPNTPGLTAQQVCGTATCINTTDLARANSLRYLLGGIIGGGSRTANLINATQGFDFGPSRQPVNYEIYSGYISDQWRVLSNLTLNLGVRYEYYTPLNTPEIKYLEPIITDPNDIGASIRNPNGSLGLIGGNAGSEGDFTKPDTDNFAPSVSFAYSPRFGKGFVSSLLPEGTVIRGGFRINYVNDEYVKSPLTLTAANRGLGAVNIQARDPITNLTTVRSSLSPLPGFDPLPSFTTLPTIPNVPVSFEDFKFNLGAIQLFGVDPNLQLGRVYEYNIGIQREIGFKTVFEIRYVGSRSDDLIRTTDFNEVDVRNNGFLDDFRRAQGNLFGYDAEYNRRLQACIAAGGTASSCAITVTNTLGIRSAAFNMIIPGSQQLTVFPQLNGPGVVLTSNTYLTPLAQGEVGQLAQNIILNRRTGSVVFQANPNIFLSEIVTNGGKYRYNALQAEIRRRFSNGLAFQVNYTFQKTLSDIPDDSQNRQGELQDSANPDLNFGRADYDRTHTINSNIIYELPFGKGKTFFKDGIANAIFGGFQFSSIVNLSSGPPLGIIDPRGTSSIAFKSGRQSATSSLTSDEIKALTGVFNTPNGIFFIDPKVLYATGSNGQRVDLNQPLPPGVTIVSVRATSGIGQEPFAGQVFFFNEAGSTGNLPRNFLNGLPFLNWDAGLSKNIRFGETNRLQLRMDVFNVLNRQVPFFGSDLNINSNDFGRVTQSYNTPRIFQFGARFDF